MESRRTTARSGLLHEGVRRLDDSTDRARAKARRAYRWALVPLAILLIVGGALGATGAIAWRVGFVPFVHGETMARVVAGALGVGSAVIGVGLLYRSWAALWAMLVYNALGHLWFALGCLFDPGLDKEFDQMTLLSLYPPEMLASLRYMLFGLLLVFGVGFTIGIYIALRPVYRVRRSPAA